MVFTNDPSAPNFRELDLDLMISGDSFPAEFSDCYSTTSPAWATPSFDNWTWTKDIFLLDLSSNDTIFVEWEDEERNHWTLILLLFPLLTIFGNLLVCLSVYREPNLRTVTNYFIVSLAVADIMVAILVMPLAVYVEVKNGVWDLGDRVCDTWVAFDVLCCTASILNLTAISVDRCIAVTQPLKYAKHKASKQRVVVTLALTWFLSIAISSPIVLGMNYTDRRLETPWMCAFYNSDFIIYSSMGSFYIPCALMIALYYRIFRSIRRRARRSAAPHRHVVTTVKTISGSASEAGTVRYSSRNIPPITSGGVRSPSMAVPSRNTRTVYCSDGSVPLSCAVTVRCSGGSFPLLTTGTVHCYVDPVPPVTSVPQCSIKITELEGLENQKEDEGSGSGTLEEGQEPGRVGQVKGELVRVNLQTADGLEYGKSDRDMSRGKCLRSQEVNLGIDHVTQLLPVNCSHFRSVKLQEPVPQRDGIGKICALLRNDDDSVERLPSAAIQRCEQTGCQLSQLTSTAGHGQLPPVPMKNTSGADERTRGDDGPMVIKMSRRTLRRKKKKKEAPPSGRNSSRRERKVTKTLAVVLGVFLLSWFPFFTTNIINAICMRYESPSSEAASTSSTFSTSSAMTSSSSSSSDDCGVAPLLFSFFVWLGYINSFLNPVIYTILNPDFRKAFKKILTHKTCRPP